MGENDDQSLGQPGRSSLFTRFAQSGGFSRAERTLLEGGRGGAVIQQRIELQQLMHERFEAVIGRATGRRVIGFMSGNQQPEMMCDVFILAPAETLQDLPAGPPPAPTD